ncbi:hypothetical protein [Stomatohabitans albus]|uniref:hypothetical protein n=1 Tax=Stomatohabitans albus TaxID=3110766 RepID=UPI00300D134C
MPRRQRTLRTLVWIPILIVFVVGTLRVASPPPATLLQGPNRGTLTVEPEARGNYVVGEYTVSLTETNMTIIHPDALADVWSSPVEEGFLSAATGISQITTTGNLARVIESWEGELSEQTITRTRFDSQGGLWTYGELRQPKDQGNESIGWQARWRENPSSGALEVHAELLSSRLNRIAFSTKMDTDEHFFGGGLAYTQPDQKAILVLPRFQGVGRGDQPLTLIEDILNGEGGSVDTSQAPLARVTTDAPRTQWVTGDTPVVVDGRNTGRLSMTAWSNEITLTMANRRTPAQQIGQLTTLFGTMRKSPSWASDGLIITDPGTSNDAVLAHVDQWVSHGNKPGAVLVRELPGDDHGEALQTALHERGIRLIATVTVGANLDGFHVDGFMVEGAELLQLKSDYRDVLQRWTSALNTATEQIDKPVIMTQAIVDDYIPIPMFINVGNLNANFSINDGLPTAVSAMVNGGISGLAFTNVTIGGDTTVNRPFLLGGIFRSQEHIARSAQLAVFSGQYRTGLDTPTSGIQLSDDAVSQAQINRWLSLRRALTPIRNHLNDEALKEGIPPVRETILVQPDDRSFNPEAPSFFYGNDIYVVPVVTAGQRETTVDLPQGNWRNVWTGKTHLVRRGERGHLTLRTPIDQFPLFTRVGTSSDTVVQRWIQRHGQHIEAAS